jgi:cephalosporin hydroxylase
MAYRLAKGGPIMVVLDSNHDTETVYNEMVLYHGLVTPGSYMVVEDGLLHYLPQEGSDHWEGPDTPNNWFDGCPLCAIHQFEDYRPMEYNLFELDDYIQNMFPTTQHPNGWLRRR